MIRHPIESNFYVDVSEAAVDVTFAPTQSRYTYRRLGDHEPCPINGSAANPRDLRLPLGMPAAYRMKNALLGGVPCVRESFARKSSCSASVRRCYTQRTSRGPNASASRDANWDA